MTAELTSTPLGTPDSRTANLYAAIAAAWYWLHHSSSHIHRPMQPFVLGPDFAASVAVAQTTHHRHIVTTCARIVSLYSWELPAMRTVTHPASTEALPQEGLDPTMSAWHPLDSTTDLGIHFWKLGSGLIDLRRVGPFDQAPPLQFGRFAAAEQKLLDDTLRVVRTISP